MNLKPLRRKLYGYALRYRLLRLAAVLDPGPLVRLWDKDFNLIADSDRGDHMPSFKTIDDNVGRWEWHPATSVRLGGHA